MSQEIALLMADTKCSAVRVLDMHEVSPMCDFFVVANGTSPRQMRSVIDDIEDLAEGRGSKRLPNGRSTSETWIALDLGDIIVHVFTPDARIFYDIDNLWADAKDVDFKQSRLEAVK